MKPKEIRELHKEELSHKLHSLNEELYKLRFQATTGRLEKPHRIKQIRKDVARIETILREKDAEK